VNLANNHKKDYSKPSNLQVNYWNCLNSKFNTDYLMRLVENNQICGFAIPCGLNNDITVIDYDMKETTNPNFINLLQAQDTLTIKTPSGGFHFIFKYTPILNKSSTGIFGNVDIRTKNIPIFHGIREDGFYSIYKKQKIKKLNDNLICELLKHAKATQSTHIQKSIDVCTDVIYNSKIRKYDLIDQEIYQLLDKLPNEYLIDFDNWLKITSILKRLDKIEIWDVWSKKANNYNKNRNLDIWNNLNEKDFYNNDLSYLLFLVKYHNKEIKNIRGIERIYNDYKGLKEEFKNNAIKINKNYLEIEDIDSSKHINIIKSSTGTGKTTIFINYAKEKIGEGFKILSIVHLKSIADDHYNKFNKAGLNCLHYKDIRDIGELDYNLNNDEIDRKNGFIICINSILKICNELHNLDFSKFYVYLDEITAIIEVLLKSPTIKRRKEIIINFNKIIRNSKGVIITDADINDNVMNYIESIIQDKSKIRFTINEYQNFKGKIATFINDYEAIKKLILNDVKCNKAFIIPCNTKRHIDEIEILIKAVLPDEEHSKILKYTSKEGEEIKEVNEEWRDHFILFSPTIVQGVDFTIKTNVYCLVFGDETLSPLQVCQQIARQRNPDKTFIFCDGLKNKKKFKNGINEIREFYKKVKEINETTFKDLIDTKTTLESVVYLDNEITNFFYRLIEEDDILRSSFKYNIKKILINKGYEIKEDLFYKKVKLNQRDKTKETKEIREIKKAQNDEIFKEYLNGELKENSKMKNDLDEKTKLIFSTRPDKERLKEYQEILMVDYNFKFFYNIYKYLLTDYNQLNKYLKNRNKDDIFYKTFNEPVRKIQIYKQMLVRYAPEINIYKFQYNENEILNNEIKMTDADYTTLKIIINTRKRKPSNKLEFLRMIYYLARDIFGSDIITLHKLYHRINGVRKPYNIIKFNDNYFYFILEHIRHEKKRNSKIIICPYIQELLEISKDLKYNKLKLVNEEVEISTSEDEESEQTENLEEAKSNKRKNKRDEILNSSLDFIPYNHIDQQLYINDIS
jgi:hypothetical protein